MKTAITILAGLVAGVLVAVGILAVLVFAGPVPVGLQPTPQPTPSVAPSVAPSPSLVPSASPSPAPTFAPSPSLAPSANASSAPSASAPSAAVRIGQRVPILTAVGSAAP